jgi:hypothetical protein
VEPSNADKGNAYHRGMPGIVISRAGIYSYGPEKRGNTTNPKGYPPPVTPPGGVPPEKLERRTPPPWVVKNQWPEGTGENAELLQVAGEDEDNLQDNKAGGVIRLDWSDEDVLYGKPVVDAEDFAGPW